VTEDLNPTVEDEQNNVFVERPHLVVLGAGASRAAFPEGDKNGKRLPLMADLVDTLGLRSLLICWDVNPDDNFEDIYSVIYDTGNRYRITELQRRVDKYFVALEIGEKPTIYDHL
jgi:hypothetical protein